MSQAIFRISDGTTTIDLLNRNGYHVNGWNPETARYKQDGYFQQSALSSYRRLVNRVWDTTVESISLSAHGANADILARESQDLRRLLEKAADYWATDWQNTPVYIEVKAKCETNTRRAYIMAARVTDGPILSQPFMQPGKDSIFENISLIVERLHWHASPSSSVIGQSVSGDSEQEWFYQAKFEYYANIGTLPDLPTPGGAYVISSAGNNLIACDNDGDMYYSTDATVTWAATTNGSGVVARAYLKINDNYLLISDGSGAGSILLSTDQGVSVNTLSTDIGGGPIARLTNGTLIGADGNDVYTSTDLGINWTMVGSVGVGSIVQFAQNPLTGTIIADIFITSVGVIESALYRSDDLGVTWSAVRNFGDTISFAIGVSNAQILCKSDGTFVKLAVSGSVTIGLYISKNDGLTWIPIAIGIPTTRYVLFADSDETIYVVQDTGGGGFVFVYIIDSEISYAALQFQGTGEFLPTSMTQTNNGNLFIGGFVIGGGVGCILFNVNISSKSGSFGGSSDTILGLANKQNFAQLTHIFIDDGGVFSANLFPVSAAFDMFPAVPAANDAIYFGSNATLGNVFTSLFFNILQSATSTTSYTITWEYYNGAWTALTVVDNTDQFQLLGPNTVHWIQPSDWATVSINSITAYWVRARVSAITGTMTPPEHANSPIATFTVPYADIALGQVLGDIPALSRLLVKNLSDNDGPGGSGPDLYSNRIIVGLRSYDRGSGFFAYLNASDQQVPVGLTISLGTNCSYADDKTVPTNRRVLYNPGGVETMASRVKYSLATAIARDFYGVYHAFLRVHAGDTESFIFQLVVNTGSGGVTFTSKQTRNLGTSAWELIDFGQVTISPPTVLSNNDIGDSLSLDVQVSSASGTPNLFIFDLVLIPVDEWVGDFVDESNTSGSAITNQKVLDIDSIEHPKRTIRAMARDLSDFVFTNYNPITNGPAMLQNNEHQRLWFLSARTSATGSSFQWLSEPWVVHSLVVSKLDQYLGLRGDR